MMRLYLSSFDIGNFPEKLVSLFQNDKLRIGIIMNAMDYKQEPRDRWLEKNTTNLTNLGFKVEEIDLRNFFKNKITKSYLESFDGLWVNGGNVFILQRAFEQSGFRNLLVELLKEDKLVYAGFSASLYVICPTLHGSELVDDPNIVPQGYAPEFSWEGLGILPKPISVHYKSDHAESADIDKEIGYFKEHGIDYEVLRDGEVYFEFSDTKEFLRI